MLNASEILQTLRMIDQNKLDVRTITMGISLLECVPGPVEGLYDRVYDRIVRQAEHLVPTGEQIEREFGIPIVNKRISVTPAALLCAGADPVRLGRALDRAQGHDPRGRGADPRHPGDAGHDRRGLLLGERGHHQGRHQHGRRAPDGRGH